jgi:hypothetical protein
VVEIFNWSAIFTHLFAVDSMRTPQELAVELGCRCRKLRLENWRRVARASSSTRCVLRGNDPTAVGRVEHGGRQSRRATVSGCAGRR